ncbi:MAG TPA: hypothetical protein DHW79_03720 [Candidatus Cloacimonas sp.]|jgi:hypothetical protein|nr:hypothetical protein [Candidatus Cloacimonas sp.]
MRFKLIIIILFLASQMMAASNYGLISSVFEVSAVNMGMGGSPISAATYWQISALGAYSNPAFSSQHEGLSYSVSTLNFLEHDSGEENETLEHDSKLLRIGYRGFGLLLSLDPLNGDAYATETDYGEFVLYDTAGNPLGLFYPRERSGLIGCSIDVNEFAGNFGADGDILPLKMDLALGLNHMNYISQLGWEGHEVKAKSNNLGILAKVPVFQDETWGWEAAAGASLFNAFDQSKPYTNSDGSARIYKRLNTSFSLGGSYKNKGFGGSQFQQILPNIATFRIVAGLTEDFADDPLILSCGMECGLFDVIYGRGGYYHDSSGEIEGFTGGLGVNMHYGNVVGIRGDVALFPTGYLAKEKSIIEIGAYLDLFGVLDLMSIRR